MLVLLLSTSGYLPHPAPRDQPKPWLHHLKLKPVTPSTPSFTWHLGSIQLPWPLLLPLLCDTHPCLPLSPLWIHLFLSSVSLSMALGSLFSFLTCVQMTHKSVSYPRYFLRALNSCIQLSDSQPYLIPRMAKTNSWSFPCSPLPRLSVSTFPVFLLSVNGFTIHPGTEARALGSLLGPLVTDTLTDADYGPDSGFHSCLSYCLCSLYTCDLSLH